MSVTPPTPPALIEGWEVLDLLTSLVQKSLVVYEEDEQGRGRYRLLETVRQYGRDRLLESGEGEAVRERHGDWFLALAEQAEPELWSDVSWLERLEAEHDNLRAALQWCADSSPEAALRLAGALWYFWDFRAHWREALQELETPLAGRASVGVRVRWKALCAAGRMAAMQGEIEQAAAWGEESLALCRQAGDKSGMGWSLLTLRRLAWGRADLARAEAMVREALSLFREVEDKRGTALALLELGESLESEGYIECALAVVEESLAVCRQEGYRGFSAHVLPTLGHLALNAGQTDRAEALFSESLATWQALGGRVGIHLALSSLAQVAQSMGDYARATALYEESLAICREQGSQGWIFDRLLSLASVARAQGDRPRARALLAEARALGQGADACTREGHLLLELGDYAAARSRFEAGLALRRQEENARLIAWALLDVGHAAWLQGEHGITQTRSVEALGLFQELNDKDGVLAALDSLAVVALAQGLKEIAARLMGAVAGQRDVLGLQGTPGWRRPRERMGEAARAASAEPAFAAARAEGRAMSLEDAVALALGTASEAEG